MVTQTFRAIISKGSPRLITGIHPKLWAVIVPQTPILPSWPDLTALIRLPAKSTAVRIVLRAVVSLEKGMEPRVRFKLVTRETFLFSLLNVLGIVDKILNKTQKMRSLTHFQTIKHSKNREVDLPKMIKTRKISKSLNFHFLANALAVLQKRTKIHSGILPIFQTLMFLTSQKVVQLEVRRQANQKI